MNARFLRCDDREVAVDIYCLVYNHGKYLRQSLDSILMQETSFPFRVIIHDDASTDGSKQIILEYMDRFPGKFIAVFEEENQYQQGNSIWLKLIPFFTSKYIACCEGDDYWIDKLKLQKQVDYLESHLDCSACYCNIQSVDKNGEIDDSLRHIYPMLKEGDYSKKEIRHFVIKTQTASLVLRNYYPWLSEEEKYEISKAKCNGDQKTLIICGILGRVHYMSDVMAAHRRVVDEGDSWTAQEQKKSEIERFIREQQRYFEARRLYKYLTGVDVYPYNDLITKRIRFLKKQISYMDQQGGKIPVFAYLLFSPIFMFRILRKLIITIVYHRN